jgi:4-hydroxy-tetrahydrodipicolinate reductase
VTGRIAVAVLGASGRMGRELIRGITAASDLTLAGALASGGSRALGQDAGLYAGVAATGVPIGADRSQSLAGAQVALDFTLAPATADNVAACRAIGCALLIGTTGLDAAARDLIQAASRDIAVLEAGNTSIAVHVLTQLVQQAARQLPEDFDIDVFEVHHRGKRDAPSGTALELAASAKAARDRNGRPGRAIGHAALRAGSVVGEHTVSFSGPGERLELTHRAQDRSAFAHGALLAARWLAGRQPGRYTMADVLGRD